MVALQVPGDGDQTHSFPKHLLYARRGAAASQYQAVQACLLYS